MYSTIYKTVRDKNGQTILKHVQEVFDVMSKWYEKLEDGTHIMAIPDPFNGEVTIDYANNVINEIDQDFEEHESWRVTQGKYDHLPRLDRLCDNAKIALIQEILTVLNYQSEHPEEYTE